MKPKQHNTIGAKLMGMVLLTLLLALLIIISGVLIHKYVTDRNTLEQQLLTLAEVIASRSTGAMEFEDAITARENLNALDASTDIIHAELLLANGALFAEFQRNEQARSHIVILMHRVSQPYMTIQHPVNLDNMKIGEIHITASLDRLINELYHYVLITLLMSGVAFLLAFALFYRLHRSISEPIADLIAAMVKVTRYSRYDIRVDEELNNDIGLLNQGFNNMLQQIEIREQQIEHHQEHLQAEIERQSKEIADSHEQRIFWLESMASFLRHELKNTTVGVKTSLDLIERRQQSGKNLDTYISRARKSMAYMNSLLQSASEASTLEAAVYKDSLTTLNLSALIKQCCDEYITDYQHEQFLITIAPDLSIQGNADRISQLLDKLVSNALDHRQQGTAIEIELNATATQANLIVSNQGTLLPEDKQRLFELFFSMRTSEQRQESNVGLGLYVVRLITECHHGEVQAYDRLDHTGACFEVSLPRIQPTEEAGQND